jgi:hypothetical protein
MPRVAREENLESGARPGRTNLVMDAARTLICERLLSHGLSRRRRRYGLRACSSHGVFLKRPLRRIAS